MTDSYTDTKIMSESIIIERDLVRRALYCLENIDLFEDNNFARTIILLRTVLGKDPLKPDETLPHYMSEDEIPELTIDPAPTDYVADRNGNLFGLAQQEDGSISLFVAGNPSKGQRLWLLTVHPEKGIIVHGSSLLTGYPRFESDEYLNVQLDDMPLQVKEGRPGNTPKAYLLACGFQVDDHTQLTIDYVATDDGTIHEIKDFSVEYGEIGVSTLVECYDKMIEVAEEDFRRKKRHNWIDDEDRIELNPDDVYA